MIVSQLAKKAGVSSNVVRYYTKIGLVEPRRNDSNGYKLYQSDDIHKIKFILRAKELGFTLNHIRELLDRVKKGESVCALVRDRMEVNIEECEKKISQLSEQKSRMESALKKWQRLPNEYPNTNVWCHLIEQPDE